MCAGVQTETQWGQNLFFNRNGGSHPRTSVDQKKTRLVHSSGREKGWNLPVCSAPCPINAYLQLLLRLTLIHCTLPPADTVWNAVVGSVTGGQDMAAGLQSAESMKQRETSTWWRGRAGAWGTLTGLLHARGADLRNALLQ